MNKIIVLTLTLLTLVQLQGQQVVVTYDLDLVELSSETEYSRTMLDYHSLVKNRVREYKGYLFINDSVAKYITTADMPIGDDSSVDLASKFTLNSSDVYYTKKEEVIRVTEMLVSSTFTIKHPPLYEWELINESKIINGITCYKAISTFKDIENNTKTVEAYYAPSLPYDQGPAAYIGLPGLILKLKVNNLIYTFNNLETLKRSEDIPLPTKNILSLKEFQAIFKASEDKFNKF